MEHIIMSRKERTQLIVFSKLKNKEITQLEAALQLKITPRWVREKFKRYIDLGDHGLIHKSRNRDSPKRWPDREKGLALNLLRSEWQGFGPTFAAEKLKDLKNISVSKETLRQVMIKEGLWHSRKAKSKHRKRRMRRARLGLLVQLDGSPQDWFEGRGQVCTLLVFIDDATSNTLWLEFVESESHLGVMKATKNCINMHGIPHAYYVDFGSVFSVNLNNKERDKITQWQRAVMLLGIEVVHARSPQAKGRVERANGTFQDRLVKELRLAGISSIAEANQFLSQSNFIKEYNQRFSVSATEKGDCHKPATAYDLEKIFCIKEYRTLTNDYTITYKNRIIQLLDQQLTIIRPKETITVNTHLDNKISLSIRDIELKFTELSSQPNKEAPEKIIQPHKYYKRSENSRRWASGLAPKKIEGRVG